MSKLTSMVIRYNEGSLKQTDLFGACYRYLLAVGTRRTARDEDTIANRAVAFLRHIDRMAARFDPETAPFETYLWVSFRLYLRRFADAEYHRDRIKMLIETGVVRDVPGTYEVERWPAPEPEEIHPIRVDSRRSHAAERRALIAFTRHIADLTCADARRYGHALGLSGRWVEQTRTWALEVTADARRRTEQLRETRDRVFAALLVGEERLANPALATDAVRGRVQRYRHRLDRLRQKLARRHATLTHEQIAGLLGIPKGTIASGLADLRKNHVDSRHDDHSGQQQQPQTPRVHRYPARSQRFGDARAAGGPHYLVRLPRDRDNLRRERLRQGAGTGRDRVVADGSSG